MARRHIQTPWASSGDTGTAPLEAAQAAGWTATEPPFQLFNWLQNLITEMLEHIEQNGIADWSTDTAYVEGAFAIGSDRLLYRAVQANTGVNPTTDGGANWALFLPDATSAVAGKVRLATIGEVATGASSTTAVSPVALSARIATDAMRGLVELATNAEAAALSDTTRAVTPGALGAMAASLVQRGIVQLASNAEVLAGTNATKAVTPQALAQGNSIAASGYERGAGGMIRQWGTVNLPASPTDITLPLTFPNNIWGAVLGGPRLAQGTWDSGVEIIDTSTIRIGTAHLNQDIYWWAWGN